MAGSMFIEKDATRISKAILSNDRAELKKALKDGEDPHFTDRKHNTYLHYVCTMHRPVIFHMIVGTGLDVNAKNRHGNTALHVTALMHQCCHVGDLLAAGIDPKLRNRDNKTAAEIPTKNIFWKSIYDRYEPGIFEAIANHDVDKVLYLLHCWSRVDTMRDGQTLRQFAATRKFHDIVFHIDVHRHTLGAIYAILEGDAENAWRSLSHSKCDINLVNYAAGSCHILQHAIKQHDLRLVRMICRSKVNVNIPVTIHGYLKAPLFFAAIDPNVSDEIMWCVLKASADFSLKDERGRNAAIYALDKTSRMISLDVIAFMLKSGLDVSQRDTTGVTLRDVARFARRRDIVNMLDKAFVKLIRTSNLPELERLSVMGYNSMLIDYNYRDSFIFASGNETEETLVLIQQLPNFFIQVKKFHSAIHHWSLDRVASFLTSAERPDLLINSRDKGGRAAIHLCILYWRPDLLKLLLSKDSLDVNAQDNLGRSAYHYACAVAEDDERREFCVLLENANVNVHLLDCHFHKASDNVGNADSAYRLNKERKMRYGMEKQLMCVDKYEQLRWMMHYKGKTLTHFNDALCRFKYPVPQFSTILSPLMSNYKDLIFVAMDRGKESIAVKLIQYGTDWRRKELCQVKKTSESVTEKQTAVMSVVERAKQLGMAKVLTAIEKKKDYYKRHNALKTTKSSLGKNAECITSQSRSKRIDKIRKIECRSVLGDKDGSENFSDDNQDVTFEEEELSDSDEDEFKKENSEKVYDINKDCEDVLEVKSDKDIDNDEFNENYSEDSFSSFDDDEALLA